MQGVTKKFDNDISQADTPFCVCGLADGVDQYFAEIVQVPQRLFPGVQTAWQNRCSICCATLETAAVGRVYTML